jgi:hypothetical protein
MRMARRFAACLVAAGLLAGCASPPVPPIEGMVWQPDNEHTAPKGRWSELGVRRLLVQWTAVDGIAFVQGSELPAGARMPDWPRIAGEPWAREVILGLAGRFDEQGARASIAQLAESSARLARLPHPVNVAGWYFPVEIDPTWKEAPQLAALLNTLPRPLWISVYDSANVGPEELGEGLQRWLPPDVGVFFQDGVGVHAREAWVARYYANVLARRLGKQRVRIIAEAFRPREGGGFRPATAQELVPQLRHYQGFPIYLFEARYVDDALVDGVAPHMSRP